MTSPPANHEASVYRLTGNAGSCPYIDARVVDFIFNNSNDNCLACAQRQFTFPVRRDNGQASSE